MLPDKNIILARFWAIFKVHILYKQGTSSDLRPIVSCSVTMVEFFEIFMENYIKSHEMLHASYIQDIPETKNPNYAILVVVKVIGLS